jgi:hypothetical protein
LGGGGAPASSPSSRRRLGMARSVVDSSTVVWLLGAGVF